MSLAIIKLTVFHQVTVISRCDLGRWCRGRWCLGRWCRGRWCLGRWCLGRCLGSRGLSRRCFGCGGICRRGLDCEFLFGSVEEYFKSRTVVALTMEVLDIETLMEINVCRGLVALREGEPRPIALPLRVAITRESDTLIISIAILPRISVGHSVLVGAEDIEILVELVAVLNGPQVQEELVSVKTVPLSLTLVYRSADFVRLVSDVGRVPSHLVEVLPVRVNMDVCLVASIAAHFHVDHHLKTRLRCPGNSRGLCCRGLCCGGFRRSGSCGRRCGGSCCRCGGSGCRRGGSDLSS